MEVWMTEGPRVNFVMCEALFEIYTWIFCLSYLHEKQTSRIQSLYLFFIKIVTIWLWNIVFLKYNRAVFRTTTGTVGSYITKTVSWKNGFQHFSDVHRSRKHRKCKFMFLNHLPTSYIHQLSWSWEKKKLRWFHSGIGELRLMTNSCYSRVGNDIDVHGLILYSH